MEEIGIKSLRTKNSRFLSSEVKGMANHVCIHISTMTNCRCSHSLPLSHALLGQLLHGGEGISQFPEALPTGTFGGDLEEHI